METELYKTSVFKMLHHCCSLITLHNSCIKVIKNYTFKVKYGPWIVRSFWELDNSKNSDDSEIKLCLRVSFCGKLDMSEKRVWEGRKYFPSSPDEEIIESENEAFNRYKNIIVGELIDDFDSFWVNRKSYIPSQDIISSKYERNDRGFYDATDGQLGDLGEDGWDHLGH